MNNSREFLSAGMVSDVWVKNCFNQSKIFLNGTEEDNNRQIDISNEINRLGAILNEEVLNEEEYINIDNTTQTCPELLDDKEIAEIVKEIEVETESSDSNDYGINEEADEKLSINDIKNACETIQKYFSNSDYVTPNDTANLFKIKHKISEIECLIRKQKSIKDYICVVNKNN